MVYVIGDIHGCYEDFQKMLKKINFEPQTDIMIFVGDYIDRGPNSIDMMKWVDRHHKYECYQFIRGNHEEEFIAYVELLNSIESELSLLEICKELHNKSEYFDMYGTIRCWLSEKNVNGIATLNRWANIFRKMPTKRLFHYDHQNYIVTHAGYSSSIPIDKREEFNLYAREEAYTKGGMKNAIVIAGHTPTIVQNEFTFNNGDVFMYYDEEKECTFYDIDCGCCFKNKEPFAKLACIRLDDKQIFYT